MMLSILPELIESDRYRKKGRRGLGINKPTCTDYNWTYRERVDGGPVPYVSADVNGIRKKPRRRHELHGNLKALF